MSYSLVPLECPICGKQTPKRKSGSYYKVFCSSECDAEFRRRKWSGNKLRAGIAPVNGFKDGHKPANPIRPGERRSRATERKKGDIPPNKLPIGSIQVRVAKGVRRSWIKIAEPNEWNLNAIVVWEKENLRHVKDGHVVHHIDENTLNDNPSNLQEVTRSWHINHHRPLLDSKRKGRKR